MCLSVRDSTATWALWQDLAGRSIKFTLGTNLLVASSPWFHSGATVTPT